MDKDTRYLVKKSLQLWFWIDKLQGSGHIDNRYDKHLLSKVTVIQKLVNEKMPDSDIAEDTMVWTVNRNIFCKKESYDKHTPHRIAGFGYDVIKAFIHNEILRKFDYDPLIEAPISYKNKVRRLCNK